MADTQSSKHTHPVLVSASLSFVPLLTLMIEAMRRRRIRRSYGRMSEVELRDIGLTPYELEEALSMPLEKNASDALDGARVQAKW